MDNVQLSNYEHLWVDIKVNNKLYSVNALYRPSTDISSESHNEFLNDAEILLRNLSHHNSDTKILASDHNFGNCYSKYPILSHKPLDSSAPELFSSYGMQQLIDIPTRISKNTLS